MTDYFFCGIGGSGMLPLAMLLRARGHVIAGSDRSFDQGRSAEKFAWLERQGIRLFPQDGSGITDSYQVLIASAAIESTVPEVARADELGCKRMSRAEALSGLFNAAPTSIGVAGTSGKSTVTGMIGWIMADAGRDPGIMNGAVMKNFVSDDTPFASARGGGGDVFVSEVDESDGSIALYEPFVAVLLNVTLDHKSMDELRTLFGDYLEAADMAVVNADDDEAFRLVGRANGVVTFGIDNGCATIVAEPGETIGHRQEATIIDRREDTRHALCLAMPGRHNLSNALAAIAAASEADVPIAEAVSALGRFEGLARRFDVVGETASGIVVIDDFGHNPEKVAATLRTLKAEPGRVIAFFQPHGYGPIAQMGRELADVVAGELDDEDRFLLCDPVYFGGTTDKSIGSADLAAWIERAGGHAVHLPGRDACADRIVEIAAPRDRIVVMGARDDTLSKFAADLLDRLA